MFLSSIFFRGLLDHPPSRGGRQLCQFPIPQNLLDELSEHKLTGFGGCSAIKILFENK